MTQHPNTGEHPDLEALASLDEGLVEAPQAAAMADHLASCDTCRARQTGVRTTRELLGALPAEPIPGDVAARLDAALSDAAATGTTVVPPSGGRRRWAHHPTLPGVAAAFVTLALIAAVVVGVIASSHGRTTSRSGAPVRATAGGALSAQYPITASGLNYTKPTISRLVERLLAQTRVATTPAPPATGLGATVTPELTRLHGSRIALDDCVAALTAGGPPQTPLAVDFARYNNQPAVVVVLPGILSSNVDAWVVGPACDRTDEHLLLYASLPRPG